LDPQFPYLKAVAKKIDHRFRSAAFQPRKSSGAFSWQCGRPKSATPFRQSEMRMMQHVTHNDLLSDNLISVYLYFCQTFDITFKFQKFNKLLKFRQVCGNGG
jgi:hypothetical protein